MRFACLIGAALAFVAFFFTAVATNIYAVILFFGMIGGQYDVIHSGCVTVVFLHLIIL
jgi:hypothetical protein